MEALRRLLGVPDASRVDEIEQRVDSRERFADDLQRALPRAMEKSRDDPTLVGAMSPTIERVVQTSVERNPQPLIDALFPIIGPIIRKAIAHSIGSMVQAVNRTVEHTLTIRGLRWRLEAWRTGRPFAEIVLANSLVYRVEQVLLVHVETGLLLEQVALPDAADAKDPALVSGMLTALQDFVQDSFAPDGQGHLDRFRVGDLTVLVDRGPRALVACVVRGTPSESLGPRVSEVAERVHSDWIEPLQAFDGDPEAFESTAPLLETLLIEKQKPQRRRGASMILWGAAGAALVLLLLWLLLSSWYWGRRISSYLARLDAEPGLVVVQSERSGRRASLVGLRDPLAVDPSSLLAEFGLAPADIDARWVAHVSAEPGLTEQRARVLLAPPATVALSVSERTLRAAGHASRAWITEARRLVALLPSVAGFEPPLATEEIAKRQRAAEGVRLPLAGTRPQVAGLIGPLRELDALVAGATLVVEVEIVASPRAAVDAAAGVAAVLAELRRGTWRATRFHEHAAGKVRHTVEFAPGAMELRVVLKVGPGRAAR